MLIDVFNTVLQYMNRVNTIASFIAVSASIIVAIIFFSGLFQLRKAFKEFRLTLSRLAKVYWHTRSSRHSLIRLYLELLIIRSGGLILTKEMFKEINNEFLIMRNSNKTIIKVDDCSYLTASEFNEFVKHYFDFFSNPKNGKKYLIPQNEPLSFISTISIVEGFLSPFVLIDGLIVRYQESWPHIIDKYKEFASAQGTINTTDLSFLFSWLLWGPSWQPFLKKTNYAVLYFAYGDENNAIPVVLPVQCNEFVNQGGENNFRGECCEIQTKLYHRKSYLDAHWEQFTPEYQYVMQKYRDMEEEYCSLMEYQSHNTKLHLGESKYYCTAYLWIMLERLNNNYSPFSIEDCIVMFEHANLADNNHRTFLLETLIAKTISYLSEKYKERKSSKQNFWYRFCMASSNDVRKAFQNKLYEQSKNGYQYLKDFVIAESARIPINILNDIDNVFNQNKKTEYPIIEEAQNNKEGIIDLCNMYGQIFLPAFPNDDERESLENLIRFLQSENKREDRHIIHMKTNSTIVGSIFFSYFHEANSGYIPYIVIDPNSRKKGYARAMFEAAMKIMEQDAKKINKKSLKHIYLEIDKYYKNIPPSVHLWHSLGFKRIDLTYIQPPLNKEKKPSDNLILVVRHKSPDSSAIPANDVKIFIKEFFTRSFDIPQPILDDYVKEMVYRLGERKNVQLLSIMP
ncbi:MAG: GNAT family N-acetyltransferase [Treponema sp.]|jgi:ribosomal protein S18 acetylase RimI-like enzyme|nr:GNAT family N-acetyltransferase [Treponema sp.]